MESSRKSHGIKLFDVGPFTHKKKDKDKYKTKGENSDAGPVFSPGLSPSSTTSSTPSPEKSSRPFSRLLSRSRDSKERKERSLSAQPRSVSNDAHHKKEEFDGGGASPGDEHEDLGSERDGCPTTRNRNYNTLPSRMSSIFGGKLSRPKSGLINAVDDEKKSQRSSPLILRAGSRLSMFDFRKSNLSLSLSMKSSSDRGESDGDRDSKREDKKKTKKSDEEKREMEKEQGETGKKKDGKQNIKILGKKIKKGFSSLFHHKRDKKDKDSGVDDIRESDEDGASAPSSACEKTDESDMDSESIGNFSMSSHQTSLCDDEKSINSESTISRHEQRSLVSTSTISDGGNRKYNDKRDFASRIPIIDAVRDHDNETSSLEMAKKVFGASDQQRIEKPSKIPGVHSTNLNTLTSDNASEKRLAIGQ